eukprot:2936647-Pyramimonas_sp.AAC.1
MQVQVVSVDFYRKNSNANHLQDNAHLCSRRRLDRAWQRAVHDKVNGAVADLRESPSSTRSFWPGP